MIQAKGSFVKCGDWFTGISHGIVWFHPSVSLNNENICCKSSGNKIAVCGRTAGLRCGKFSDLKSAC